jgi:hypothetical protein
VKLTLQRREGGEVHQFETKLMRGTAEYFQSLSATRSMEDEIDQLRLQLRFAPLIPGSFSISTESHPRPERLMPQSKIP